MMYSDLINFLMILSHGIIGFYTVLLIEFKEPQRFWRRLWIVLLILFLVINGFIRVAFGGDAYMLVAAFTLTLPYLLIILWCSRYKGLRVVFCACTCLWMGCIADAAGLIAQTILGDNSWIRLAVRVAVYIALYLVLRLLRPYYLRMLRILDYGWGVLCFIPAVTYLTVLYMVGCFLPKDPVAVTAAVCGITALSVCAYILIYLFFMGVRQSYELKNSRDLMKAQILTFEQSLNASRAMEDKLRIQRHDMRHQWITLAELVKRGDEKATLDFIDAVERRLDEIEPVWQCGNSILNATFSSYFYRAREEGIEIEAELSVGEELPVDPAELSMAFANALDNAIKACVKLPRKKRKIVCRCVDGPPLKLKIENPYIGEVKFSEDGYPVDENGETGVGARSILAFCEKYNAEWKYRAEDGLFRLEIAL